MNPLFGLGKVLIIMGLVIAGIGILLVLAPKVPWLGMTAGVWGPVCYLFSNFIPGIENHYIVVSFRSLATPVTKQRILPITGPRTLWSGWNVIGYHGRSGTRDLGYVIRW